MFSDLHQVQWEPVSAMKTCLMFCGFYYMQWEPAFSTYKKNWASIRGLERLAMVGHAKDRGGLKDSKNAPNSFFPKISRTRFWRFGTDMFKHVPSLFPAPVKVVISMNWGSFRPYGPPGAMTVPSLPLIHPAFQVYLPGHRQVEERIILAGEHCTPKLKFFIKFSNLWVTFFTECFDPL